MTDVKPPSRKYAGYVLGMMLLLYLLNYVDRFLVVGLVGPIKETYGISDTYMGFLIGPAFAMFYTIMAIPIALLADRFNRVYIISIGAIVWSVFTVTSGLATTPEMFALSRVGVGIGEAAFVAPAYSLLSDYFAPRKRAMAFAILNLGVYMGQICGAVGGPKIAEAFTWQTAFLALGLPGILLGVFTILTVREPVRGRLDGDIVAKKSLPFMTAFTALIKKKSYVYMLIGAALGGFGGYGFGYWGVALFERAFELSNADAGQQFGLAFGVPGVFGALIIGWLCDKLAPKDARWPLWLSAMGVVGSMVFMLAVCFAPSVAMATALAIPSSLLGGGWVIAMQSSLQDLMPGNTRATGTSIWGFALTFTGLALGVQFAGLMIDQFSDMGSGPAIRSALSLTLLTCIPAALFIVLASRTVVRDREDLIELAEA